MKELIGQDLQQSILHPDAEWHNITSNGAYVTIRYRIRIRCDLNYYNTTCTKFCKPRDDQFGHYTCDANGDKICKAGWMGAPNCEQGNSQHSSLIQCISLFLFFLSFFLSFFIYFFLSFLISFFHSFFLSSFIYFILSFFHSFFLSFFLSFILPFFCSCFLSSFIPSLFLYIFINNLFIFLPSINVRIRSCIY